MKRAGRAPRRQFWGRRGRDSLPSETAPHLRCFPRPSRILLHRRQLHVAPDADGPRQRRERPHTGDSGSLGHAPDDFGRRGGTGQRNGHKTVPEFGMQHNPRLQLAAQRMHACRQGILEAFRQGLHRRHPQIRLPDHELKPVLAVTRGAAFPVSAGRIKMNSFHRPAHPLLLARLILKKCVRKVDFRPPGITFSLFPTRPYRRTSCQSIS